MLTTGTTEFQELLISLNLQSYEKDFKTEGFDEVSTFNEINEKDVEDFKFLKTGHKKKLILYIQKLKKESEEGFESEEILENKEGSECEPDSEEEILQTQNFILIDSEEEEKEIEEITPNKSKKRKRVEKQTREVKLQKMKREIPELNIGKLFTPAEMIEMLKGNQENQINSTESALDNHEIYVESLEENLFKTKLELSCRFIPKNKYISWIKSVRDQIALNLMQGKKFLATLDLNEERIFNAIIQYIGKYNSSDQMTFLDYLCFSTIYFFKELNPAIVSNIVVYKAAKGKFDYDIYSAVEEKELIIEDDKDETKHSVTLWLKMTGCNIFDSLYSNGKSEFDMSSFPSNFDPPHQIVNVQGKMDQLSIVFETISEKNLKPNFDSGFSNILDTWSLKLKKMKAVKKYCFIGESRVGKSTCINNLLGVNILPTSADVACTSSIICIAYSETLKISIETMNLEELENLIANSREEYSDFPDGHSQKKSAEATLKAIFGSKWKKSNQLSQEMLNIVATGKIQFESDNYQEISKLLIMYSTPSQKSNKIQFWPIVKIVNLSGPFEILKDSNIEFIDLPGLHDANEARAKITRDYLSQASCICLVSRLEQIESSPIVRNIFKEQVLGSGIPTMVITSKIDSIHCKDVRQNHRGVIRQKDSESEIISFQKRRVNMILEDILKEEIEDLVQERSFFQKETLTCVPYFGITFKGQKKVSDFNDLKNWFETNGVSNYIELCKLVNQIETFLSAKVINSELKVSESDFLETDLTVESVKTYFNDAIDEHFGKLEDKMQNSKNEAEKVVTTWKTMHVQTFMATLRRCGIFRGYNFDQQLMKHFREELFSNMSHFFGFGEIESIFSLFIERIVEEIEEMKIFQQLGAMGVSLVRGFKEECELSQQAYRKSFLSTIDDRFASYTSDIYLRAMSEVEKGTGVRQRLVDYLKKHLVEPDDFHKKYEDTCELSLDELNNLFEQCVIDPLEKLFNSATQMLFVTNKTTNVESKHQNELKFMSKAMKLIQNSNYDPYAFNQAIEVYKKNVEIEKFEEQSNPNVKSKPELEEVDTTNIPDPKHCTVDIKSLGYARIPQKFKIIAKNSEGNCIKFGGSRFKAFYSTLGSFRHPLPVEDQNDGTYLIPFKSMIADRYFFHLELVVGDEHFELGDELPFTMDVLELNVKRESEPPTSQTPSQSPSKQEKHKKTPKSPE
eukprot:gene1463-12082_t